MVSGVQTARANRADVRVTGDVHEEQPARDLPDFGLGHAQEMEAAGKQCEGAGSEARHQRALDPEAVDRCPRPIAPVEHDHDTREPSESDRELCDREERIFASKRHGREYRAATGPVYSLDR